MTSRPDDQTLVERAKQRDERALAELYERCAGLVFTRIRRICGDHHLAEDLSHDCWARAFEKLDQFTGDSFRAWIHRMATNLAIDHLRREKLLGQVDFAAKGEAIRTTEPPPDSVLDRMDLEACLDTLPAGYRAVLLLRLMDDLPHEEIAERLGIAPVTSRTQFHKARARMIDCLTERAGRDSATASVRSRAAAGPHR